MAFPCVCVQGTKCKKVIFNKVSNVLIPDFSLQTKLGQLIFSDVLLHLHNCIQQFPEIFKSCYDICAACFFIIDQFLKAECQKCKKKG